MLSHEAALERHLAKVIANTGTAAAHSWRARDTDHEDQVIAGLGKALRAVLLPSLVHTAETFAARLGERQKAAGSIVALETKTGLTLETKLAYGENYTAAIREAIALHVAERITGISESLRAAIANVISDGVAQDLGTEAIAANIVEATSGEIGLARARRIARTEVHFAAMFGQIKAAEASPLQYEKEWLPTEDLRVRKGHAEMNEVRVKLADAFVVPLYRRQKVSGVSQWVQVGSDRMRYPGDPEASAANVINCRCSMMMWPVAATQEGTPEFEQPGQPPEETPQAQPTADDVPEIWLESDLDGRQLEDKVEQYEVLKQVEAERGIPANLTLYVRPDAISLDVERETVTSDGEREKLGSRLPSVYAALAALIGTTVYAVDDIEGALDPRDVLTKGFDDVPFTPAVVVRLVVPKGFPARPGAPISGRITIGLDAEELLVGERITIAIRGVEKMRYAQMQSDANFKVNVDPWRISPRVWLYVVDAEVIPFETGKE